ncbi:hypothetical protein [Polaromonas sp.]|uniref:hypothetical protein n=1 Tax=Polaromonas sp. TaxID=1869339 RepID=UPI003750A215
MSITALPAAPSTSDPTNFAVKADALLAALPAFVNETNATAVAMNLNATTDTSASSVAIGTGVKSFTVSTGKSYQPGMWLVIADTAAPSTNQMYGTVTSYDTATGALVMNIVSVRGSGTKTAWVLSQSAPGGAAVGVNADVVQLDALTGGVGGGSLSSRNKIIGHFDENQRGSTSAADDVYDADRWYVLTESGSVTTAKITDPESGAPWARRLTQPDAAPKPFGYAQIIESKNIRAYRSVAMNFFMRVKPSFAGNVRYAILEWTGTADAVTSDVVLNWASASFTPGGFFIATVNVIKTGTVAPGAATYGEFSDFGVMGSALNNAILVVWTESAQAQNATLELNRPQFEPGVVHTPHEWRPNEMELCQRYLPFWSALGGQSFGGAGLSYASTAAEFTLPYQVQPRVIPTSIQATPNRFAALTGIGGLSVASTVTLNGSASTLQGLSLILGGTSGLTAGDGSLLYATGGAATIQGLGCEL